MTIYNRFLKVAGRFSYILSAAFMIAALLVSLIPPSLASASAGAIWTTGTTCTNPDPQDDNLYFTGETVYIRGSNFDPNKNLDWEITQVSGPDKNLIAKGTGVTDSTGYFCVTAHTIQSGESGTFTVDVTAAGDSTKNDNYRVTDTTVSPTPTNTSVPPTATNTAVPPTATNTSVPPTATNTAVPPTATNTPVPPTATNTEVPPTATNTLVPPTATNTEVPPTATNTLAPPTPTETSAPPTPTNTSEPPTPTTTGLPTQETVTPPPGNPSCTDPNAINFEGSLPCQYQVLIPVTGVAGNAGRFNSQGLFLASIVFFGLGLVLDGAARKLEE